MGKSGRQLKLYLKRVLGIRERKMIEKTERRFEPQAKELKTTKIGKELKRMREAIRPKLDQADVEKALGMSSQHLSQIELDKANPPLLTLSMLTEFYGHDVADLFLPARIYKEYPNKEHARLHTKVQQYIEQGYHELELLSGVINAFLRSSARENRE